MVKHGDAIYVIRYALTRGIVKAAVNRVRSFSDGAVEVAGFYYRPPTSSVNPTQRYYLTEAEAREAAERMRTHKLHLLQKQAENLAAKEIRVIEAGQR